MRKIDGSAVEISGVVWRSVQRERWAVASRCFVVMDARAKLFQLRRHHAEAGGYAQNNSQNLRV
jgi:hypothetical protein